MSVEVLEVTREACDWFAGKIYREVSPHSEWVVVTCWNTFGVVPDCTYMCLRDFESFDEALEYCSMWDGCVIGHHAHVSELWHVVDSHSRVVVDYILSVMTDSGIAGKLCFSDLDQAIGVAVRLVSVPHRDRVDEVTCCVVAACLYDQGETGRVWHLADFCALPESSTGYYIDVEDGYCSVPMVVGTAIRLLSACEGLRQLREAAFLEVA